MTIKTKAARARDRAERLRKQALNCVKIAVTEGEAHSAELIDEALKLAKRSRELGDAG